MGIVADARGVPCGEEWVMPESEIADRVIEAAIEVHRHLGPGLLKSVYEDALCHEFHLRGMDYERHKTAPIPYKGILLESGLCLDLIVEGKVIVGVKAVAQMGDVDHAETMTSLRLTGRRLGLNINFHEPVIPRGVKRIFNDHLV